MTALRRKIQWNPTKSSPGKLVDLDTEYQELLASVQALRNEKDALRKKNKELRSENGALQVSLEQVKSVSDLIVQKGIELAKLTQSYDKVNESLEKLKKEEGNLKKRVEKLTEKIEEPDKDDLIRNLENEVEHLNSIIMDLEQERNAVYKGLFGKYSNRHEYYYINDDGRLRSRWLEQ